jgi:iron-sulfur cluster repair protein YtfE (RIC family)
MNVEALRKQHEDIGALADQLSQAVSDPAERRPVAALRWRLARELIAHLAIEDRYLYPAMIARCGSEGAKVAARFRAEMGDLAERFTEYMAGWSDPRIAEDWPGFRDETRAILATLAHRIALENDALYPLADTMSFGTPPTERSASTAVRC